MELPRDVKLKIVSFMDIETRRKLGIYRRLKPLPSEFKERLEKVVGSMRFWMAQGWSDRLQWRTTVSLGQVGDVDPSLPRYTIVKQQWGNDPFVMYMYHTFDVSHKKEIYGNDHSIVMETIRMPIVTTLVPVFC